MKMNPRPDWPGAPVYLPDVGELQTTENLETLRWFGEAFWRLVNDIDILNNQENKSAESHYDDGYADGVEDTRRDRLSEP